MEEFTLRIKLLSNKVQGFRDSRIGFVGPGTVRTFCALKLNFWAFKKLRHRRKEGLYCICLVSI